MPARDWAGQLEGLGGCESSLQPIAAGSSASAGRRPMFGLVVRSALRADLFKKHPSLLPAESRRGSPAPALRDRRSRDVTCLLDSFGPGRLACLPRLPSRHFGWWSHLGVHPSTSHRRARYAGKAAFKGAALNFGESGVRASPLVAAVEFHCASGMPRGRWLGATLPPAASPARRQVSFVGF